MRKNSPFLGWLNKSKRFFFLLLIVLIGSQHSFADRKARLYKKAKSASVQFAKKASAGTVYRFKYDSLWVDPSTQAVKLIMNPTFSYLPFRPENVNGFYREYHDLLGRKFRKSTLSIESMGKEIGELIPNFYRNQSFKPDISRMEVQKPRTAQIVRNQSKNASYPKGLSNRNIAMWQSHGWYYENTLDRWEWQRARVFLTVEDLWTASFILPYLTPMLENAGATVWLPRERDLGTKEIIVDQELSTNGSTYSESGNWQSSSSPGFALKYPFLFDGENPFQFGKSRLSAAKSAPDASVQYLPEIPETGDYAVYTSYEAGENKVKDAHYTITHAGGKTTLLVNQTIGGGTWIYLGTFRFDKGKAPGKAMIELSNESVDPGKIVSADAIRLGGGMGNIVRGNGDQMKQLYSLREEKGWNTDSAAWLPFASQRPRYQEAARYFLQYAGFPDSLVYNLNRTKVDYSNRGADALAFAKRESGKEDYKDDYMCRGEWVNYLMGSPNGPTKQPDAKGLGIPMDLSLGFHTDAGTTPDSTIIGALMIYDTTFDKDQFPNGQSKWASRDLADIVQSQVINDLKILQTPNFTRRGMWNKRYFEAARPKVPAILSELLSHQNFADMYQAMDPRFKFDVCRAFYKGMLKFVASRNGMDYVVQPLPVSHFGMTPEAGSVRLYWSPVKDPLEKTAIPTAYRIYQRIADGGFDDGFVVKDTTLLLKDVKPGTIYSFKVSAVNEGGESFPSEILACSLLTNNKKPALIVNGFNRICAPAAIDNGKEAGFVKSEDEGVPYLNNMAYIGEQYDFNRKSPWLDDDASGFGSSYADKETLIEQGNSFDYAYVHGKAFQDNGIGFISMSRAAFETQKSNPASFSVLDLIFGEEKTTSKLYGLKNRDFTIYTPAMREAISTFTGHPGAKILITGAYLGSDLALCGDTLAKSFAAKMLHYKLRTNHGSKSGLIYTVNSLKKDVTEQYNYVNDYHPTIYKLESPDAIEPAGNNAEVLFRFYGDNKSAGVWYNGNYQSVVLTVPLETIRSNPARSALLAKMLTILGVK